MASSASESFAVWEARAMEKQENTINSQGQTSIQVNI